jgi:hypothetical protein
LIVEHRTDDSFISFLSTSWLAAFSACSLRHLFPSS